MNILQEIEAEEKARLMARRGDPPPDFRPGDTVRVNVRIKEGDRERVQAFEGVCIGLAGGGVNENFTVRKISFGEGVERVFPVLSPMIESIEVKRRGEVRRAKLYYLRDRRGKSARIKERKTARAPAPAGAAGAFVFAGDGLPLPEVSNVVIETGRDSEQPVPVSERDTSAMAAALGIIRDHDHAISGPEVRQLVDRVVNRIPEGPVSRAELPDVYRASISLAEHLAPLMFSDDEAVSTLAGTGMARMAAFFFEKPGRTQNDILARFLRHLDLRLICHLTVTRTRDGAEVGFGARDLVHSATREKSLLDADGLSIQILDENPTDRWIKEAASLMIPAKGETHFVHRIQGSTNDLGTRVVRILVEGREVISTLADGENDVLFVV